MSQLLVAVFNNTPSSISIWNSEAASNAATVPAGQVLVIQGGAGHWNIPDCSDSKYFPGHHMEIRPNPAGAAMFSFWGNDRADYLLQTCPGTHYDRRTTMTGDSSLGNNANVMIKVEGNLTAVAAKVAGS
jgi:hypothetical protein